MTDWDHLILDQVIYRRVGEPGTVTHVNIAAETALSQFKALAERASENSIELVTVSDGIPGHFSVRGANGQTVVFHERQVEICAFLHGVTLEDRFDEQLSSAVFEGTLLRLISEFLLQGGHADQALATQAKSRKVLGGIFLEGPSLRQLEDFERNERFMVEWFFALGHEIGHNLGPDPASMLGDIGYFDTQMVEEIVNSIIDAGFGKASAEVLKAIIRRGDRSDGARSHASADVLRRESVADLFSFICLSEAWATMCKDRIHRDYYPEQMLYEAIVSMSSVMAIEQCRMLAGWFSTMSTEIDNQSLLLLGVALQVRMNLLHLTLRDQKIREFLSVRYPSIEAFSRFHERGFANAMQKLEDRSLRLEPAAQRARKFLSSTEMRDPRLLQGYFDEVARDSTLRYDAVDYLRVARHINSPTIDWLRSVVNGAPPPIVSSAHHARFQSNQ